MPRTIVNAATYILEFYQFEESAKSIDMTTITVDCLCVPITWYIFSSFLYYILVIWVIIFGKSKTTNSHLGLPNIYYVRINIRSS